MAGGAQLSFIPTTKVNKEKGHQKFILQSVINNATETYSQEWIALNLNLRCDLTHSFINTNVEKAILSTNVLHKYIILVDTQKHFKLTLRINSMIYSCH